MTSAHESYDLVILGSGSTAFAAATHASDLGKTVIMTEFRTVGGTCANRGCLPSKNLIEAAKLVYDATHPRYPGLSPAHLPFDWSTLVAQKDEIIEEYRANKYLSHLDAGEVIHEAAMAMRFGATADDFIDLVHVYPTMAEALKLVAISFTKDVRTLSCCAS